MSYPPGFYAQFEYPTQENLPPGYVQSYSLPQNDYAPQQFPSQSEFTTQGLEYSNEYRPAYSPPQQGEYQTGYYPPQPMFPQASQQYAQQPTSLQQEVYPLNLQPQDGSLQGAYSVQPAYSAQLHIDSIQHPIESPSTLEVSPSAPIMDHDPNRDADELHQAMKGQINESNLISMLGKRTYVEIAATKKAYQQKYGQDLIQAVDSALAGNFRKIIEGLLLEPLQYDSIALHEAITGADQFIIISILLGRTNEQKLQIANIFYKDHARTLETAIQERTGDAEMQFLLALLTPRNYDGPVDENIAREDAEKLCSADELNNNPDEAFIDVLTNRSWSHLQRTFSLFETIHKQHYTIERAISNRFGGTLLTGLRSIALFTRSPGEYYAELVHHEIVSARVDQLVYVIVGNRDRLPEIKQAYSAKYNTSLYNAVEGNVSGDYKKVLLSLLGD